MERGQLRLLFVVFPTSDGFVGGWETGADHAPAASKVNACGGRLHRAVAKKHPTSANTAPLTSSVAVAKGRMAHKLTTRWPLSPVALHSAGGAPAPSPRKDAETKRKRPCARLEQQTKLARAKLPPLALADRFAELGFGHEAGPALVCGVAPDSAVPNGSGSPALAVGRICSEPQHPDRPY